MDKLRELLTIDPEVKDDIDFSTDDNERNIHKIFRTINSALFQDYCIMKGKYCYEFVELEYYFYNRYHKDVITYQRKANPGDWLFHESGVDICFDSKVNLEFRTNKIKGMDENMYFGGVLIRGLKRINGSDVHFFMGPQVCCNELFDQFSAFPDSKNNSQYPYLSTKEHLTSKLVNCGRYFEFDKKIDSDKFEDVGKKKWKCQKENWPVDEATFKELLTRKYRWYDASLVQEWIEHKEGFSYKGELREDYYHIDYADKCQNQETSKEK